MRNKLILSPRDRLIFACDFDNISEAMKCLYELRGHITMVKIGMQMFTAFGPQIIKAVKGQGFRVWLDLKYMDIPNTVKGAIESVQELDVDMATIHLLGGSEMIETAVEVANSAGNLPKPLILGVSILTSLDDDDLIHMGFKYDIPHQVHNLVHHGHRSGIHGVVCSANELPRLRSINEFDDLIIITPGIRLSSYAKLDDQKRVSTPYSAIFDGADFIVVGRALKTASNKKEICDEIVGEIKQAMMDRTDGG